MRLFVKGLLNLPPKPAFAQEAIYEWRISGRTRQANAFVSGVGAIRRILLTDTLISRLSTEEVEAIVAHELGHCALHHVAKRVLPQGDWTCGRAYGSVLVAAFSRKQERDADLYSWKRTGRAESFITGLRKVTDTNPIVLDKGSEWRFTHPATSERLAAVEQFARANGELATAIPTAAATGSESNQAPIARFAAKCSSVITSTHQRPLLSNWTHPSRQRTALRSKP
jgi:predicted Zn-dependent protease